MHVYALQVGVIEHAKMKKKKKTNNNVLVDCTVKLVLEQQTACVCMLIDPSLALVASFIFFPHPGMGCYYCKCDHLPPSGPAVNQCKHNILHRAVNTGPISQLVPIYFVLSFFFFFIKHFLVPLPLCMFCVFVLVA